MAVNELVIQNGTLVDGAGSSPRVGALAIDGDPIVGSDPISARAIARSARPT